MTPIITTHNRNVPFINISDINITHTPFSSEKSLTTFRIMYDSLAVSKVIYATFDFVDGVVCLVYAKIVLFVAALSLLQCGKVSKLQ